MEVKSFFDTKMKFLNTLTKEQKQVLNFIQEFTENNSYPPSLKDIQKHFGFSSHSTAQFHVNKLIEQGFLKRKPGLARGIDVVKMKEIVELPILGYVVAGTAIEAIEDTDPEIMKISKSMLRGSKERHYLLRVQGKSMIEKHILPNDLVLIKEQSDFDNGDVVVVADENWNVTLKEVIKESKKITLKPANKDYQIYSLQLGKCQVIGKMVGLIRQ